MIDMTKAGDTVIMINRVLIASHVARRNSSSAQLVIDEDCLRWTPLISSHSPSSPDKSGSSPEKLSLSVSDRMQYMSVSHFVGNYFLSKADIRVTILSCPTKGDDGH